MDGDQNTYKDEFSAAPPTELACESPVPPPERFVGASKQKPQQTAFISVKPIVGNRQRGAE